MTSQQTDLVSLIDASKLLTEAERAYWREHLPNMTPQQCEKLTHILTQAADLPWQRNADTFLKLIQHNNSVLEQHISSYTHP